MNQEEQEIAGRCEDFVSWLKDELQAGNQGIDIELGEMKGEDAIKLLKLIVSELNNL